MPIDPSTAVSVALAAVDSRLVVAEKELPSYTPERLINARSFYKNAEWTRTAKHKVACPPLVNPIEFGSAANPERPGTGLFPLLPASGQYGHPNTKHHLLVTAASYPGGVVSSTFSGSGGGIVYARHLEVTTGRYSWQLISEWLQIEGMLHRGGLGDCIYIGGATVASGDKPVGVIQGNRCGPTWGTDRAPTVTDDPFGTVNVTGVTAARMISNTQAEFDVSGSPPDGMPANGKVVIVEGVGQVGVNGGVAPISQGFSQPGEVAGVAGNTITVTRRSSSGDLPASGATGTVSAASKLFVMGGSQANEDWMGEHADSMGQMDATKVFSIVYVHGNVGLSSYQPGGIFAAQHANQATLRFSCCYAKQTNTSVPGVVPVERGSLAVKIGRISEPTVYDVEIADFYIDCTERPWISQAPVSPSPTESAYSVSHFGAANYVDADGYKVTSYDPNGQIRGGFYFNKPPPRDYAPLANVGPAGVHPGVGDLAEPVASQLTNLNIKPSTVLSNLTQGAEIGVVSVVGRVPGNTIVDITVTNSAAQFVGFDGNILRRTGLPLPVGNLVIEFTCKCYPIDPVTHARGALAFTKVISKTLRVNSSGTAAPIVATTQATPTAQAGMTTAPYTYEFAVGLGATGAARDLLVPFVAFTAANRTRTLRVTDDAGNTLVTLDASHLVAESNNNYTGNYTFSALYRVPIPADAPATGKIVVVFSGAANGCFVGAETVTGIGAVYDSEVFSAPTSVVDPEPFSVSYGAGCLAIAWAGYSSALNSGGNRRAVYAKQMLTTASPPATLAVDPAWTAGNTPGLEFGAGFTEVSDQQVTSGGTPATAGGVVVFAPAT